MKKQNLCYAAVAACVGLCSLGSCTQEEMAYQGEQKDISKLKVITRTDDESSKPVEGKIYIFNQNNVCIDTISPSALRDNTPTRIKPGTVKLIAIGSNDLSAYNLPYKSTVTDSSIIKLNSGRALTDLILGTTTTTLEEGETTQTDITMSREVICLKHLTADNIPDDIIGTEIMVGPMYKNIKLNGKYTNDVDTIRIALQKDPNEEGVWVYKGDSIFSLPSKGNPSFILRLKTSDTTTEYTYQLNRPLTKNHFVKLDIDFREGIKTYIASSLSNPVWEGTDSICFEFNDNYLVKTDSANYNNQIVAGKRYQSYYVVSNTGSGSAVLLRKKGEAGISNQEDMDAK